MAGSEALIDMSRAPGSGHSPPVPGAPLMALVHRNDSFDRGPLGL